jgi:uncharacterized protein YlxP (DUF503 family)
MAIGILTLHLEIPGCTSLKEKRGRVKPLIARIHREFNLSVAETGLNDRWQEALITCALVSNDPSFCRQSLETVGPFIEKHFPELYILDHRIEFI